MFTGIIQEIGKVKSRIGNKLIVCAPSIFEGLKIGDSVNVNGVCLTVTGKKDNCFSADLLDETLAKTGLGRLRDGDLLNLEPALKLGDRFGGHMVTGHIDGLGKLIRIYKKSNDNVLEIELPYPCMKGIVSKGSAAVDGVSLTVAQVRSRKSFTVHIIPFTKEHTTLGLKRIGSYLNIEIDILFKYTNK